MLDNCEHLVQPCAEIANSLLHSVQGIRMMATSREALNVPGEVVWRIPSLSFPDPESIKDTEKVSKYEAIKLFIARAALSKPGFTLNPKNVSASRSDLPAGRRNPPGHRTCSNKDQTHGSGGYPGAARRSV